VSLAPPERVIRPSRPFARAGLVELWEHRELLAALAWRDVAVRYRHATLGLLWALLQPALQVALFTALFHRIAGLHAGPGVPYVAYVLSGLLLWNIFQGALAQGSDSLLRGEHLLSKVYFPRLILPLAALLVPLIDALAALLLLALSLLAHGLPLSPRWLLALPLAALAALAAAGPAIALAALNVRFRDLRHLLPFAFQLSLYAAPVFFPRSAVPPRLQPWLDLNPVVPLIDALRAALFGLPFEPSRLALATLLSASFLLLGLWIFHGAERTLEDQL
jgi:lipopolysaccharide transport system permease protein